MLHWLDDLYLVVGPIEQVVGQTLLSPCRLNDLELGRGQDHVAVDWVLAGVQEQIVTGEESPSKGWFTDGERPVDELSEFR